MSELQWKSLDTNDRDRARDLAAKAVLKRYKAPKREDFDGYTLARFPRSVMRLITALCFMALVAAFVPSAIRLYAVGSKTFVSAVSDYNVQYGYTKQFVGLSTVVLAEIGQVVFSLALAVLGGSVISRRIMWAGVGLSTVIALVGNIQVALPGHELNPFAWLEAVSPPLLVIGTAYLLKEQMLTGIARRYDDEQAYQDARREYEVVKENPTAAPEYDRALRLMLWGRVVSRSRQAWKSEWSEDDFSAEQKLDIVYTELRADDWASYDNVPVLASDGTGSVRSGAAEPLTVYGDETVTTIESGEAVAADPFAVLSGNGNGNGRH